MSTTQPTITATQVVNLLNTHLGVNNLTSQKVQALADAGAFTAASADRVRRYDADSVDAFVRSIRYVTPEQWPDKPRLYRVSILALRPNLVRSAHATKKHPGGKVVRTHAGADYANTSGLSPKMRRRAWTGVWSISDATARELVEEGAIVYATTKGYIHPDYVRTVTGYERVEGGRILLKTSPAPKAVTKFVSTGLWMDVKPGRENDWA